MLNLSNTKKYKILIGICILFFIAYSTLSIIRHEHYGSYGFDLGIADQVVWHYSRFEMPITTVHYFPYSFILADHVELIYALFAPAYWLYDDTRTLLILQAFFICLSAIPVFLLCERKKVNQFVSLSLVIAYLAFYGIQNALWFDVHSATLGAAFIPWFIYFLDRNHIKGTVIFLLLILISKENMGLLTFLISFVYFTLRRDKLTLICIISSVAYVSFIFFVYFPHIIHVTYGYQNKHGLLSNLSPETFANLPEKRIAIFYSLLSFGFLPLFTPLYLIPAFGDLYSYFVIASDLHEAQGIFMHYRVTLAALLVWPAIMVIARFKFLNTKYLAIYLLICTMISQYTLHLPLSYLTKAWFWTKPASVKDIEKIITYLPTDSSIVAQNNIAPHIAHQHNIFTLWPDQKKFKSKAVCGKEMCQWMRWYGNPEFVIVDTSKDWDIRHFLANREDFIAGLKNVEKNGYIKKYKQIKQATIYRILKNPSLVEGK